MPLPESRTCAPQRRCQPGLVFLKRYFRTLAIVDLQADAGNPSRQTVTAAGNTVAAVGSGGTTAGSNVLQPVTQTASNVVNGVANLTGTSGTGGLLGAVTGGSSSSSNGNNKGLASLFGKHGL